MPQNSISVVIPVYNGEKYVKDALDSVLQQSCQPKEIIVVNDGSTDQTQTILASYQQKFPQIQCINKKNGGPNSARNAGIRQATGDFIAFLDADDVWEKEKLAKQMAVFQQNFFKNLGVVYCDYNLINEAGEIIPNTKGFQLDSSIRGNIFETLKSGNKVASSGSGVLIKKECLQKTGFFDENLRACEDWDMWLNLAQFYEFDYAPEKLVKIRKHNTNAQHNINFMLSETLLFYDKWI